MAQLANKIKDHFLNPRNVGRMEKPSCSGEAGNPTRGSGLRLFLRIGSGNRIERATYQVFNNAPAIAPASAFTELVVGRSLEDADRIGRQQIMDFLECNDETAGNIRFDVLDAYTSAVSAFHEFGEGAEGGLAIQRPAAESEQGATPASAAKGASASTSTSSGGGRPKLMLMQLIQDVLDSEIRPAVAMDGGDVELVDVEDKRVYLRLHGHCVGCNSSQTTMRFFIEDRLKQTVDPSLEVIDVTEFEGEKHAPPGFMSV